MSLAIRWLPNAEADIDYQAGYYLETATFALFDRFRAAVLESLKLLAVQPELGERLPLSSRYSAEIRRWQVTGFREHWIFYRQVGDYLEVVRVLHAKRDIDEIAF